MLEEYRTLREELLMHLKQSHQVLFWSGSIVAATLGIFFRSSSSIPPDYAGLALLTILTPIVMVYRHESFIVGKIASYIQHRIESKTDGLNWTKANFNKLKNSYYGNFELHSTSIGSVYFAVLFALAWVLILAYFSKETGFIIISFSTILSFIFLLNIGLLIRYKPYRRNWDLTWEESELN